jgi:hypothetical protein
MPAARARLLPSSHAAAAAFFLDRALLSRGAGVPDLYGFHGSKNIFGTMVRRDKGPHCSKRPKVARPFVFPLNFNILTLYFA